MVRWLDAIKPARASYGYHFLKPWTVNISGQWMATLTVGHKDRFAIDKGSFKRQRNEVFLWVT
jgi:hypothetical protein